MRATTRHQRKCRAFCQDPCAKFPSDCWVPRPRGSPRVRAPPRTPRRAKNATGAASDADSHQGTSRRRRAADLDRSPSRDRACDHLARRLASSQHITCFADREKRGPRSRLADDPPPRSLLAPRVFQDGRHGSDGDDEPDGLRARHGRWDGPRLRRGTARPWLRHGKSFPRRAPARPPLQRRGVRHPRVLPGSGPRGRPHRASRRAHHGRGVRPVRQPHAGARRDRARSLPSLPSVIRSRRRKRDATGHTQFGRIPSSNSQAGAPKKKRFPPPRR